MTNFWRFEYRTIAEDPRLRLSLALASRPDTICKFPLDNQTKSGSMFQLRDGEHFASSCNIAKVKPLDRSHLDTSTGYARQMRMPLTITFVGIVVRALLLQSPLHTDEMEFLFVHYGEGWRFTASDYYAANNHIAYNLIVQMLAAVFGNELWVIRFPAFVFGCLLIPVTAWAGTALAGRRTGLYAAAMIAICPLFINYSFYARGYSMMMLLLAVSVTQLTQLHNNPLRRTSLKLALNWSLAAWTIPITIHAVSFLGLWSVIQCCRYPRPRRQIVLQQLLLAFVATGAFTLLLYIPVFAGSGWQSLLKDPQTTPLPWNELPAQAVRQLSDTAWMLGRDYGPIGWVAPLVLAVIGITFSRGRQRQVVHMAICAIVTQIGWMLIQRILPFPRAMLPLWWTIGILSAIGIARLELFISRFRFPWRRAVVNSVTVATTLVVSGLILHGRQTLGINGSWPDDLHQITQSLVRTETESRVFTNYADAGLYYYLSRFQPTARVNRYVGPGNYIFMCRKFEDGLDNVTRTEPGLNSVIAVWRENGGPAMETEEFKHFGETRYYQLYRMHAR